MALVRRVLGVTIGVVLLLAIFAGGWLAGRSGIGSVVNPASLTLVRSRVNVSRRVNPLRWARPASATWLACRFR